jgi:hypothetical protein
MATVNREGVNVTDGAVHVALQSGGVIPSPTITGVATFADGTSALPSITFAGAAADDGFYQRTNNTVDVAVAAVPGYEFASHFRMPSNRGLGWNSGVNAFSASDDTTITRASANSLLFGPNSTATARTELNKTVGSIANAVATDVLTITIPNAAHSASLLVRVTGSLGAGGAIGANEATATNTYILSLTRTAGVNATAAISSAFGAAATAVAGAATVTATAAVSSVSGAVGAANTFTVTVTISRSGGSSTNHTCLVYAQLMNANSSGVTIS